jgi:hypothetical protein
VAIGAPGAVLAGGRQMTSVEQRVFRAALFTADWSDLAGILTSRPDLVCFVTVMMCQVTYALGR